MMFIPDEMLMAYADGELTLEQTQALEQLLSQDAALRIRLEPFVETRMRISYAFEHKLHEPVPDRLIAAITRVSPPAVDSARRRLLPKLRQRLGDAWSDWLAATLPNGVSPAVAASIAALLLTGATTGWLAGRAGAPSGLIDFAGSQLMASGSLAHALETSPSGVALAAGARGASITPVLSFHTQANGICREYRIADAGADGLNFAGLACRTNGGQWRLALHVETPRTPAGDGPYQTATSSNVAAVDALTETLISGDAFGRDDEAALLGNGWQFPEPAGAGAAPARDRARP